jgi:hypothetical protein
MNFRKKIINYICNPKTECTIFNRQCVGGNLSSIPNPLGSISCSVGDIPCLFCACPKQISRALIWFLFIIVYKFPQIWDSVKLEVETKAREKKTNPPEERVLLHLGQSFLKHHINSWIRKGCGRHFTSSQRSLLVAWRHSTIFHLCFRKMLRNLGLMCNTKFFSFKVIESRLQLPLLYRTSDF